MGERIYGCVEAGGTKFVCSLGNDWGLISERARIPTTTPEATLAAVRAFFAAASAAHGPIAAYGIGSFGPIDRDRGSPGWGKILQTPKPGWSGTPLVPGIVGEARVPIGFDTDVAAAAMAEAAIGGIGGVVVYVTVGTGIGGGVVVDGVPLDGERHAEMGHFRVPRHAADLGFAGRCPYHGDCLEGIASGPAIIDRWGRSLSELPEDHVGHDIIAQALAHLSVTLIATLSPRRIALGGGVLHTPGLIDRIRREARAIDNGYLLPGEAIDAVIAPSALDGDAGLLGALMLARRAAEMA
ncbi:fructokinase [Sphingomonas spermidinifaciens]|uniref:fructokinase n=1 Tax=Sphingomonas spermidinifaciens TaxID=1141889 RepID=A0A2A4B4P2_9SPHN|nr:ROK family protein [Sphingomonas spermidinifaciens]PCD02626.1 fructokinase [Sphingomonas spermidinifaciens]